MDRFRFVTTPFTREIKAEHRFKNDAIEIEVERLWSIVQQRQSAALIGPAGSGKTVVIRTLLEKLPQARFRTIYLKLADLSARDMCRQIALGLNIPTGGNYPTLVRVLEEQIRSGYSDQSMRQVLIFDDAHELRPESLRLMRLLTNFDMDSKLVVSVILAGHLQLKNKLMDPALEDVKQRLNYCGEIRLLSREETRSYIKHRVSIAGSTKSPFAADAIEAIFEISQGNMRAIDKLSLAALHVADAAGCSTVSSAEVAIARSSQWM